MSFSREDRSRLAMWWFTIDYGLVVATAILVVAGLVLSLAASPVVALKKGWETFHFVQRHAYFSALGVAVMFAVSMLSARHVRRLSVVLFAGSLVAIVWALLVSPEINGARRWLFLGGFSIQPSEFAKPAFIVLLAWLFAEGARRTDMPALPLAGLISIVLGSLLVAQPDIGLLILVSCVGVGLYLLAGLPLMGAGILAGLGLSGLCVAYFVFDHVQSRIDRFFLASPEKYSQLSRAYQSFIEGGFFGRGPGEGTIKTHLPDAHTDFILAVVAEEYGVLLCLGLLAVYGFIVVRVLIRAVKENDDAIRLSVQGLALLLGVQVLINMGVNIGVLPATGMTLPFISAGGSSMLAISLTVGMLLALTRRRVGSVGVT